MHKQTHIFLFLVIAILVSSCGKFEKIRKLTDEKKKYAAAVNYYKKGEFDKAGILLEEIVPIMKGGDDQEMATLSGLL
ncbi:hypothetical protein ACFFJX_29105 [Pseudarcicella hirudinis]|uniref:hypothetical protein n=1 Tax=Pseudarcicella hirudinis TaxID=1079859 RepID=UPI0035E57A93